MIKALEGKLCPVMSGPYFQPGSSFGEPSLMKVLCTSECAAFRRGTGKVTRTSSNGRVCGEYEREIEWCAVMGRSSALERRES